MGMAELNCRGCFALGTACRKCPQCCRDLASLRVLRSTDTQLVLGQTRQRDADGTPGEPVGPVQVFVVVKDKYYPLSHLLTIPGLNKNQIKT